MFCAIEVLPGWCVSFYEAVAARGYSSPEPRRDSGRGGSEPPPRGVGAEHRREREERRCVSLVYERINYNMAPPPSPLSRRSCGAAHIAYLLPKDQENVEFHRHSAPTPEMRYPVIDVVWSARVPEIAQSQSIATHHHSFSGRGPHGGARTACATSVVGVPRPVTGSQPLTAVPGSEKVQPPLDPR